MNEDDNVLVVGAGPTGLMLAIQLARHGLKCRLIDSKKGPTRESRAMVLQGRTMEVYEQLGLVEECMKSAVVMDGVEMYTNGRHRCTMDVSRCGQGHTRFSGVFVMEQSENERILIDALHKLRGSVEWGVTFCGMSQRNEECVVSLQKNDGSVETAVFEWVCGCDGARSAVRRALNVPFAGVTYDTTLYAADVDVDGELLPRDRGTLFFSDKGFLQTFPILSGDGRRQRLLGAVPAEANKKAGWHVNPSFGLVEHELRSIAGHVLKLGKPNWFATFPVHQRMVGTFRTGNVLLAGDAAHTHSPTNGQGMNAGLLDAHNLGWKLALVARGKIVAYLIYTYTAEREPVARQLLAESDAPLRIMISNHWLSIFFRCYILPLIIRLTSALPSIRSALFRSISQVGITDGNCGHASFWNRCLGYRLRTGDRFPPFQLIADGISVDSVSLFRTPAFYVLDFSNQRGEEVRQCVDEASDRLGFPVKYRSCEPIMGYKLVDNMLYMVRPDMHIGFIAKTVCEEDMLGYLQLNVEPTSGLWGGQREKGTT